jgi:hypothetical protein
MARFSLLLVATMAMCATALSTPALAHERIDPGRLNAASDAVTTDDVVTARLEMIGSSAWPAARSEVRALLRSSSVDARGTVGVALENQPFGRGINPNAIGAITARSDLGDRPADGMLGSPQYETIHHSAPAGLAAASQLTTNAGALILSA